MLKEKELDHLYHLLRVVSNEGSAEEQEIIFGMTKHLLNGGDYPKLLSFLEYYGTSYIVPPLVEDIHTFFRERFSRIVDIGAGTGWLARAISNATGIQSLTVDNRKWDGINLVLDVEKADDRDKLKAVLRPSDLLIMSEFLHCTENPEEILDDIKAWSTVVIEFDSQDIPQESSYLVQIRRFGCSPVVELLSLRNFGNRRHLVKRYGNHVAFFIGGE